MSLICYVASHDHFIEAPFKFMGRSFLQYVTTLIGLVTINIVIVKI